MERVERGRGSAREARCRPAPGRSHPGARVGLRDSGKKDEDGRPIHTSDVNFQVLRRTCGTLFGDKAKDPRSTQAQLRHADPQITLKHYQQAIPETVKLAAIALEADILARNRPGGKKS
jgi:integrase